MKDHPYDGSVEDILDQMTTESLESLLVEVQEFRATRLFEVVAAAAKANKIALIDQSLRAQLHDVASLFTREQILGESLAWDKVPGLFDELEEDIATLIKTRR